MYLVTLTRATKRLQNEITSIYSNIDQNTVNKLFLLVSESKKQELGCKQGFQYTPATLS